MRARAWLVLLAVSAVLVAVGIFFASQDLGTADQYASVASFFLALVGVAVAIVARFRSRQGAAGSTEAQPDRPEPKGGTVNLAIGNTYLQQGSNNVMNVEHNATPARKKRPRK
ncbi:MAG TPA: hypothetical protein VGJ41_09765 [Nocardioides sp.]|jgi:hypothetical protein